MYMSSVSNADDRSSCSSIVRDPSSADTSLSILSSAASVESRRFHGLNARACRAYNDPSVVGLVVFL